MCVYIYIYIYLLLCFALGLEGWAGPILRSVELPHPAILTRWARLYKDSTGKRVPFVQGPAPVWGVRLLAPVLLQTLGQCKVGVCKRGKTCLNYRPCKPCASYWHTILRYKEVLKECPSTQIKVS